MEEMNELFYRDPYARVFTADVLSCTEGKKGFEIVLSDTAFYPEGGGQDADTGVIDGVRVEDVRRKDGVVVHITRQPVEVGKSVSCEIDWERRFDHMQNHSGEHIVSGLIHRAFGYDNIGFHMGKDVIQIDFNGPLTWEELMEIEEKANDLIQSDIPVHVFFPSDEERETLDYRSKKELNGRVRIVEFPGGDMCACCGTHVARTGEIGLIKILSLAKYKKGVRIEMVSGKRAVNRVRQLCNDERACSALTCAVQGNVADAVVHLQQENQALNQKVTSLMNSLMEYRLKEYEMDQKVLVDVEEGMDRVSMIHMANRMMQEKHACTAVVLSKEKEGYAYFMCSEQVNLSLHAKILNAKLNGRGGGRPDNIQGFFQADLTAIQNAVFEEFGD
ncbi:MAG: alanine--tRNA ligase-related protein [Bulleidia sp.]